MNMGIFSIFPLSCLMLKHSPAIKVIIKTIPIPYKMSSKIFGCEFIKNMTEKRKRNIYHKKNVMQIMNPSLAIPTMRLHLGAFLLYSISKNINLSTNLIVEDERVIAISRVVTMQKRWVG